MPFTLITPLYLGIKLYAVFAASAAFTILYRCVKKLDIKMPFMATIIAFSLMGSGLIFRFFLSRPFTLAPALLVLLLYCLHKKKYFAVFLLNFAYLFWHSSTFYFSFGIVFVYFVFEKFYQDKGDYKNLLAGAFGTSIGIGLLYLLHSDFLLFMYDTVFGIYKETILGQSVKIPEGGELYPTDILQFVGANPLISVATVIGVSVFVFLYIDSKRHADANCESALEDASKKHILATSFFFTIAFFLGAVVLSARFLDFFVFFGGLFVILSFSQFLSHIHIDSPIIRKACMVGFGTGIIYLFAINMLALQSQLANGARVETFESVGAWLEENVPKGEIIFYPTWNWFPQLYYHSPSHNYIIGLEPRFMYVYNQKLYWKWTHISNGGYICESPECPQMDRALRLVSKDPILKIKWDKTEGDLMAASILRDFHSSYIISSLSFKNLNSVLDNNSHFEKVFTSQNNLYIYHIKQ